MKTKIRKINISYLLQPQAIFFGITVFNLIAVYDAVRNVPDFGFCIGEPWFVSERFWYFPLLLLIATLGLCVRKWWSNLIAVASCAPIIYEFMLLSLRVDDFSTLFNWFRYSSGLGLQFAFAGTILVIAIVSLTKEIPKRSNREN